MQKNIAQLHDQWMSVQPLPEHNHHALWQWIRMNFNYHSNHFEGNTLTYFETQLLLIYGRTKGNHLIREYVEMTAHDAAFDHIRELAAQERPLSEADIRDLNKICLKEPFYSVAETPDGQQTRKRIIPGQYKTQPNAVLTKKGEIVEFASPEETPALMAELATWIQQSLDKPTQEQHENLVPFLAELHQRYIIIHPFDDGNGRVVRLLMNYHLMRLDYLPMILEDRATYIEAITQADIGDMSHLEILFADNIAAMLKKGIHAKDNVIALNPNLYAATGGKNP